MAEYDERNTNRPRQHRPAESRPASGEGGRPPQKKRRRRRMGAWGALTYVVLVIGVSALLAGVGWIAACDVLALNKPEKTAIVTLTEDIFTAKEGTDEDGLPETTLHADMGVVADQLKEQDIIEYPWLFKLFVSVTKKGDALRPGAYTLNTTMDYNALVRNLSAKSVSKTEVTVVIKEGYTCAQVFQALAENNVASVADLEKAAADYDFKFSFLMDIIPLGDKNRLEGYLFPDTYEFYTNMDAVQALNKMLLRFDEVFTQEMRDAAAAKEQSIQEIVNIASLIEKETTGDDQTAISSVIYNRLYKANSETAGFLNIDAAIAYVTGRKVVTADYQGVDSPYNTYINKGLPPGPIANPGQSALRAALKPEDSNNYFYALGDDGDHHFFKTHAQQTEFIASQELYKNAG